MPEVKYLGLAFLEARGVAAVTHAVGLCAAELQGAAQEVTPTETGTLKASIHVEGPFVSGNEATAKVATGGEASDYAIVQHEHTEFAHASGGAKFIERPLIELTPKFQARIRDAGRAAF